MTFAAPKAARKVLSNWATSYAPDFCWYESSCF